MKKLSRETKIEIYNLVNQGYSYSQVAQHLNIGKTAVHNNYKKMQQESLMQYLNKDEEIGYNFNPINSIEQKPDIDILSEKKIEPKNNIINTPIVLKKGFDKYKGVIPELMNLIPEYFKGFVVSQQEDNLIDFASIISSYFNKVNLNVTILTNNLKKYEIKSIKYDLNKVNIRGSNNLNHVINTIERTSNEIIIIDNLDSMRISYEEWQEIIKSYPNFSALEGNSKTRSKVFVVFEKPLLKIFTAA